MGKRKEFHKLLIMKILKTFHNANKNKSNKNQKSIHVNIRNLVKYTVLKMAAHCLQDICLT